MKRTSLSLLSRLARQKHRSLVSSSPSSFLSPTHYLNSQADSHDSVFKPFRTIPSRNLNSQVEKQPQLSSRQKKVKDKYDLEEEFERAVTTDEMLRIFKEMESSFDEKELALASLKVGLKLDQEGEDPEITLSYATRAYKALDVGGDNSSLVMAMILQLMGSANYGLKRFHDSLGYLNRANRILCKLDEAGVGGNDVRPVLHAVQLELANVKTAMGRREDALENLKKSLEIKEMTLEEDCVELGVANRDLAEAYVGVLNFKGAMPYALKALEIHKKELGDNSVEVAHDRRLIGVIYCGLEEHQKALEQNNLSQKILKSWGLNSELLRGEMEAAGMKIELGKFEEAVDTLRSILPQTEKEGETRAMVLLSMGKGLYRLEKIAESKRCLELACEIFTKKESISPVEVAEAYSDISMQYETMNEFEKAISLLKRTLAILERVPQEQHSEGSVSARIGWLLLLTGKVTQAIPYLESAAERLKESFGARHFGIGYIYNNLGAAYLELDRPQSAAEMFSVAKDIMDEALGPHHADSIETCQNLSKAHSTAGNYELAIEFQQRVIDAWDSHGQSCRDELKEAKQLLEQLKTKQVPKKTRESGGSYDELKEAQQLLEQMKMRARNTTVNQADTKTTGPSRIHPDEVKEAQRLLQQMKVNARSTKALPLPQKKTSSS